MRNLLRRLIEYLSSRALREPPYQPVYEVMGSVYLARSYYVAVSLGVADLLRDGPRSCAEIAAATGSNEQWLFRVLRALAAFGVFAQDDQGRFHNTPRSEGLRGDVLGSMRWWVLLMGSSAMWHGMEYAVEAVKTGQSAFEAAHGIPAYQYLRENQELGGVFIRGMSSWTDWQAHEIVRAYDFRRFAKVVDVGGGCGSLLFEILDRNPNARGLLYDQPGTVEAAQPRIAERGLADRCEALDGNFLEEIPPGADAYTIKHVLRDWDDDRAAAILANCRRAMPLHGTVLVIDAVVDPRNNTDRLTKLIDMEQWMVVSGRLRTDAELQTLFRRTGFRKVTITPTAVPDASVIEIVPT